MALRALALLTALACASVVHAAPTVLHFSSAAGLGDGIASDGDGGSVDIPGREIQIVNTFDTTGNSIGVIDWRDNSWLYSNDPSYSALTYDSENGPKGMAIRSADGSAFKLTSFRYYNWGETESTTITIAGYRHGALVASTSLDIYDPNFVPRTIPLGTAFQNVDRVVLYISAGGWLHDQSSSAHSINDIFIDDAVSPLPPRVSDGFIGISGATGTGGSYRIGDTVTATWDNSTSADNIGLDNNVSGVTVDFSQFGGGTAVAASNAGGIWTARYTLTAGSIDAIGRNVAVTAYNANGPTTVADTSNVAVDNIAPVVSDARISISGGSGTGGGYRIGDTVTATWNNTASGDSNNDVIAAVNVDFSQFGGAAAVAASNSGGVWTATYTLAPGSIEASNRNISVAASDNAGNTTTVADTSNAVVDLRLPSVLAITPSGSASAADTTLTYNANFSEPVSHLSVDDFSLTATGTASASISGITITGGSTADITVSGVNGQGSLRLNLNSGSDVTDIAGNGPPAAFGSGGVHLVNVPTAPGAPQIGSATAGNGQAQVSFTAPANDGGSAVTVYTVTSSPGGIAAQGSASPISVSGLSNGIAYTFSVTASNAVGTSAASAASNPVTPKASQVLTFDNPGTQLFGSTPALVASSDAGLPVSFTSSTTTVCTTTSGGVLTLVSAGSCTIVASQPGDAARLPASDVQQTFAVAAVVPGAPVIGTATAGDGQATLTFSAPASNGGAGITGYTVTSNPAGGVASSAGSPITVPGLDNGMAYTFTVTATNSAGTGAASLASNTVTPAAAQTITFNNPGAQNFGTTPTLTASTDSGLTVSFSSATTGVCTITSGGALTLVAAGNCTIHADQAGDNGYLPATRVSRTFSVNPVQPGAPGSVVATAGDAQVAVAFSVPSDNGGSAITGYTVTVSPADVAPVNGSSSPIIVSGLSNGQAYSFSVTASNVAGTGPASTASNTVTPASGQTITFDNPGPQDFGSTPSLVASSDSGLPVVFSTTTPAVCSVSSAGVLETLGVGSCTVNADQPGDAHVRPAIQISRSFAINAVVPGAPVIGSTRVVGAGSIEVSFNAPAFGGGAPITDYTVSSSPGGISVSGDGSPLTVTGLDAGTDYRFSVVASNSAGSGSASAWSAPMSPAPQLLANDSAISVAYGSAAVPVSLDITGTASAVTVTSAPSHGSTTISGTSISYQPAAGYAGSDSFSYTASDAYTTTAPATVSVTVQAATLTLDATAPPATLAGSDYRHQFVVDGGSGHYTFALAAGALPNGLKLADTGLLSGTPTVDGSFAFTVKATDSSTGIGPFSVQQAYTLTVAAPEITLDLSLPELHSGDNTEQVLTASGGSAPYAFAIVAGTLPRGLSLEVNGRLSGSASEAGRHQLTIEVKDANGFSAQQVLVLVIERASQVISGFIANPSAPVYAADASFEVSAQGGGSGSSIVFASLTPAVCSVSGSSVAMRAAGRCSLVADQAGDANFEPAAQARLDVDIAAATPELRWPAQLSKLLGQPAFELDEPESNSPGSFSFSSSDPDVASVEGRTVTLAGAGTTVITATQAAAGNFTAASIELQLTVVERPDPTRDPGVTGLLQAQVDASVRFATTQQSNIRDRLRQVRGGSNATSSNLTLAYAGGDQAQGVSMPVGQAANTLWPALPQGWGGWLSGTASFGGSGRGNSYDFDTDGITLGFDRIVGDSLLFGIAGSLASNNSQLDGNNASRMQAEQRSIALYGLWRAGDHLFVDAVSGAGQLDFDLRRWSDDAEALGRANRDGDQWFASVSMGYELRGPRLSLTGYGRLDTSRTTLDGYRERGLDLYDLAYREQTVENSTAALGIEGSWLSGQQGRMRPFWSVEYRQALQDRGTAAINYVVAPRSGDYLLRMSSYNDDALSLSAGIDMELHRGWVLSLLLGHEQARHSSEANSVGLRLSYGGQAAPVSTAGQGNSASAEPGSGEDCRGGACRRQSRGH